MTDFIVLDEPDMKDEDVRVAWNLYQEHMHQLELEEAEKDRIEEEALLADEEECSTCFGHGGCADCMNEDDIRFDDCEVPA